MPDRQLDEEAIFHVARRIQDPTCRVDYLEQACGDNTALLARVQALLEVHEKEQEFLRSEVADPEATLDSPPITEAPGTQIGRYRLMEQIGEGGMGVVFVAEQRQPLKRKVALKVIKPGMDSKAVVARFEAERQALALMDHPNIAHVLDAGTTDGGRPYFIMEYVRGIPITDYCDQNKLTIRERLELFIQVCQAIQHAHQKGIVHRDIKPSNVLVTLHDGKPVPKVIDFGVAKALNTRLTDRTIYTEHMQVVGTLLYMSPEQAELSGLDIDTRSDVYSLGVLLYELLTGTTPFQKAELDQAGFDEQRRIIRESEPPRASVRISSLGETATTIAQYRKTDTRKLQQQVRGDLDSIAMKALEKDRTRRYETASGFAADVERFLSDEPVEARPPSTAYRLRKLASRHRVALATTAIVVLALLAATGVSTWKWLGEREQRRVADSAKEEADAAKEAAIIAREEAEQAERANRILRDLNQSLFDRGLTHVFCGKHGSARSIIETLRENEEDELADKLKVVSLIFTGGNLEQGLDLLQAATERRPRDPGLFAMQVFTYNASGDFEEYYKNEWKLEEMLQQEASLSAADLIFLSSAYTLDSRIGLKYAQDAFRASPSAVPLLFLGRRRSDFAMHTGNAKEALQAIKEVNAARLLLGNTVATRITGLASYLLAANAIRSSGSDEDWRRALANAEDLVAEFPAAAELLPWERIFLTEYYCERERGDEAIAVFEAESAHGWNDYDTYLCLALSLELGTDKIERRVDINHAGPFTKSGIAMASCIHGDRDEAETIGVKLVNDYSIPEVALSGLDVLACASTPIGEIHRRAAEKLEDLVSQPCASWHQTTVEHIGKIYAGKIEPEEAIHWAENTDYRHVWLTHTYWALGMQLLATGDYPKARSALENCVNQRVIYLRQHLWARALLANWDALVARQETY